IVQPGASLGKHYLQASGCGSKAIGVRQPVWTLSVRIELPAACLEVGPRYSAAGFPMPGLRERQTIDRYGDDKGDKGDDVAGRKKAWGMAISTSTFNTRIGQKQKNLSDSSRLPVTHQEISPDSQCASPTRREGINEDRAKVKKEGEKWKRRKKNVKGGASC